MKKFRILLITATAALLAACESGVIENAILTQNYNEPAYSVTPSQTQLDFRFAGGEDDGGEDGNYSFHAMQKGKAL